MAIFFVLIIFFFFSFSGAINDSVLVNEFVVVAKDGRGNFTTINEAVAAAPNGSHQGYFGIIVSAGLYEEYINIEVTKQNVMLIGEGSGKTVITGNRSYADGFGTYPSATFAVEGSGFVAVNITFRNTAGPTKGQAVAVLNQANFSSFYLCTFEGYQDTLYVHSGIQFYRECNIYGTVDFIFGDATVLFQRCNIFVRQPKSGYNTITAQGRERPNEPTGIIIQGCNIRPTLDLRDDVKTFLGRPWQSYSRTIYFQSFIDRFIDPAGWIAWGMGKERTLFYAEFNNSGPGSMTENRVTWPGFHLLTSTDILQFTVSNFLLGDSWLPRTGVPYDGGLL